MPDLQVTMVRSPDLSDDEIDRRLSMVYRILLDCASRSRTSDGKQPAETDGPVSSGTEQIQSEEAVAQPAELTVGAHEPDE
jgi:hypothetical protein